MTDLFIIRRFLPEYTMNLGTTYSQERLRVVVRRFYGGGRGRRLTLTGEGRVVVIVSTPVVALEHRRQVLLEDRVSLFKDVSLA